MKKKSTRVFVTILSALSLLIAIGYEAYVFFLPKYISYKIRSQFGNPQSAAEAVGIIGGADGPTAIFIGSSFHFTHTITIILGLFAIAGISYLFITRKSKLK